MKQNEIYQDYFIEQFLDYMVSEVPERNIYIYTVYPQEKIMGRRGNCPVEPLGCVNFINVIFRPIKRLKLI